MLQRRKHLRADLLFVLSIALTSGNLACWEQWSEDWFPQMKWQKAVQAFERVQHVGLNGKPQINPYLPPDGAVSRSVELPAVPRVKADALNAETEAAYDAAVAVFVNPTRPDPTQPPPFQSTARGKQIYQIYCITCHGPQGYGDGPVSNVRMNDDPPGPLEGVFPIMTATSRSDGWIYNLLRVGGNRMPSYKRIAPEDRWHLVNYVRHLQNGGQP